MFQVVLSQRFSIDTEGNSFEAYRRLRSENPSPYLFYIEFGDFQVVGSSPERLVSVKDGIVTTNPMAGTRPREETRKRISCWQKNSLPTKRRAFLCASGFRRNDVW